MTIPRNFNEFNRESLSRDATACKQSASWRASQPSQSGRRMLFSYLTSLPASNLFMIIGFIVDSGRMFVSAIQGGVVL